jgi:hypothetical protein
MYQLICTDTIKLNADPHTSMFEFQAWSTSKDVRRINEEQCSCTQEAQELHDERKLSPTLNFVNETSQAGFTTWLDF